jgi:protein-S-isoprenylcysteine O-methyltransferase Ste14
MSRSTQPNPEIDRVGLLLRVSFQSLILLLIMALLLFVPSGSLDWFMGWAILILFVIEYSGTLLVLVLTDPGLVKERIEVPGEIYKWDRLLTSIPKLLMFLVMLPLAGFDYRYGWSQPLPVRLQWIALGLFALAGGWVSWAMLVNHFFAASVRIQTDRGHFVISSGPYRWVRHPGYLGWIIQFIAAPLALGCWWALIPGLGGALCYVIRTALEDQVLRRELTGYAEYAQSVRFRLLPGIW